MIFGAASVAGVDGPTPEVDSEMRFFAAWYAGAGVLLLRAIPRVESERTIVRGVAYLFFLAGCARLLSLAVVGKPHPFTLVLMAIELLFPFLILPWHAAVVGNSSGHDET